MSPLEVELTWRPTVRLRRLAVVAAVAVVAGVASGSAAVLVLASVPLVLMLAVPRAGLPATATLAASLSTQRCVEEDEVLLELAVTVVGVEDLTAAPVLPDTVAAVCEVPPRSSGSTTTVTWSLTPGRWGRETIGPVRLSLRGGGGCYAATASVEAGELVVYPEAGALARAVAPRDLAAPLGEHPSRTAGTGVEFHGVRPYAPGDRRRDVDWRTSARHDELYVRQYAAERAFDLVLVLDTAADPGPAGRSVLDLTVRAASGLAQSYLRSHDRVGLLTFGGPLRWLRPATGPRQLFAVHEALMSVRPDQYERDAGRVEFGLEALPVKMLPRRAFVALLTPLLDDRPLDAVRLLRERGFPPLVLDVLTSEPAVRPGSDAELARRAWRLQREAWRFELTTMGVPVLQWDGDADLTVPLQHAMRARTAGATR